MLSISSSFECIYSENRNIGHLIPLYKFTFLQLAPSINVLFEIEKTKIYMTKCKVYSQPQLTVAEPV